MKLLLLFITAVITLCNASSDDSILHPLSDEFIKLVNLKAKTWQAGRNFHRETPMDHVRRLMGALPTPKGLEAPKSNQIIPKRLYPENFDTREAWPQCATPKEIRDQGDCGSCWAIASVEAMSDRVCTSSNGNHSFHFSTENLLSCCSMCGRGCNGGYPAVAYRYWQKIGIVSGGQYDSAEGCSPYEIPPCEHHMDGSRPPCESMNETTPICKTKCQDNYPTEYIKDLHYAIRFYGLRTEDEMRYELVTFGPITATFQVYEDFLSYKSGVYSHKTGKYLGGHAVKILGYGFENGTPYWLCANSWNSDWGDKGFFKILRGSNECKIEDNPLAGTPYFNQ